MLIRSRVFAGLCALTLFAGSSQAIPLSSDEAKCQKTIATQSRIYAKKRFKALQKCNDDINKGKLAVGTDCTLETKAAGKISTAEGKLTQKIGDKCTDTMVAALDFGGQCFGVATTAALTPCLIQDHADIVDGLIDVTYPPDPPKVCDGGANEGVSCTMDAECPDASCLPDKDQAKCSKTLGKTVVKQLNKRLALVQKCKKKVATGKLAEGTNCVAESQAKFDKLDGKSFAKIEKKCTPAITSAGLFGENCAQAEDGTAAAACSLCKTDSGADDLIMVQHGTGSFGDTSSLSLIADTADCIEGPNARCRVGDYLLENGIIRVVVQDVQRNYLAGIGQFGGQIIDADLVRTVGAERDNFEEWAVALNIESTAHYTSLTIINDGSNGGDAILRATGVDDLLDLLNPSSVIADFGFSLPSTVDDFDIPVTVQTDYILSPGATHVRVETTVTNTDAINPLDIYIGEFLNGSGQVEIFQSGYGFGEPLATSPCGAANDACNQLGNMVAYSGELEADGVSYAYLAETPSTSTFTTSGVTVPILGTNIVFALIGIASPNFSFAPAGQPGDAITVTRHFIVGDGSVSDLIDSRIDIQCLPSGTIDGTVDDGSSPLEGVDIAVYGDLADGVNGLSRNVVTHTRTDASGNYDLRLPPGDYTVVANRPGGPYEGGGASPTEHNVTVTSQGTTTQDITMPDTGTLRVMVADGGGAPIAGRVSVVGFDPSADPLVTQSILGVINNTTGVFGDQNEDGFPFGLALVAYADQTGDSGDLTLEPGSYRVVVSHGTEYSIDFDDIVVAAGATTNVNAVLEPVIDTRGFISGDFHVHSIDSPDAAISRVDRVVAMLGEGVDFFATTDHGFRADFSSTITSLGVGSLISTTIGQEITTFDYGHFNAWPLDHTPSLPNGGFVDHGGAAPDGQDYPSFGNYSLTPGQIIALAHGDYTGTNTVQINHTHSHFGLPGGSGLAIDTGLEPPASAVPAAARRLDPGVTNYFSDTFDGMEIWIGESRGQVFDNFLGRNAGDWMNMINQGIISTGIANSDTHRRFITQSGFPRNMVASTEDDPGSIDQDEIAANVNAGRSIGTNGPMVRITAHATSTGESGGLDVGRCTGVSTCTDTSSCSPCNDDSDCAVGETCTSLPTTISTSDGGVDITVDVQSPEWAPFDRIEFFVNTTTTRVTTMDVETGAGEVDVNNYTLTADHTHNDGAEFTVTSVAAGTSATRLEASTTLSLAGLTEDIWVAVMVSGTDNVSEPLFPVVPNSIDEGSNTTLANLIDGNLNESGITARAFTNPIYVDVDGGGWDAPGVQIAP